MDTTQITNLAVLALFAGVLILIGVFALRLIASIKPANPQQSDILHALREYAKEAYAAGVSMALNLDKQGQATLTALDIKAIADRYYALLPDSITIAGIVRPVAWIKLFVTQAEWESLCKSVADEIEARLARNAAWLTAQLGAIKSVSAPVPFRSEPLPSFLNVTDIHTPQQPDPARALSPDHPNAQG